MKGRSVQLMQCSPLSILQIDMPSRQCEHMSGTKYSNDPGHLAPVRTIATCGELVACSRMVFNFVAHLHHIGRVRLFVRKVGSPHRQRDVIMVERLVLQIGLKIAVDNVEECIQEPTSRSASFTEIDLLTHCISFSRCRQFGLMFSFG